MNYLNLNLEELNQLDMVTCVAILIERDNYLLTQVNYLTQQISEIKLNNTLNNAKSYFMSPVAEHRHTPSW